MTGITSKVLSEDIKWMPSYLQEVIQDKVQGEPLSYTASAVDFISSWLIPSYGRVSSAQQLQTIHLFPNKKCLFDRSNDKSGGISEIYPIIHNHKIGFYSENGTRHIIQVTSDTDYFEINELSQRQIVEHFKVNGKSSSRTWTVHNPLQLIDVEGKKELCYLGKLL